jgi:prepilin-type N-terminal cleavage/methylation domain-containing protein
MVKKGFTLLEVVIVMALLVILMTITFTLMNIAGDAEDKSCTILRMQRLENCLSGYYAAFGSYPPVKLHGSSSINTYVDDFGQQEMDRENDISGNFGGADETIAWNQVEAACRAQPISCEFPLPESESQRIRAQAAEMTEYASQDEIYKTLNETDKKVIWGQRSHDKQSEGNWVSVNEKNIIGRLSGDKDKKDWGEIKLFRFGLLSYLLPRYIVMMSGDKHFYTQYEQWLANNMVPSDPLDGSENFGAEANDVSGGWSGVWDAASRYSDESSTDRDMARLANIPSQAACARWIANLEGICKCFSHPKVFGVSLRSTRKRHGDNQDPFHYSNVHIRPYRPKDVSQGNSLYVLNMITVRDGWGRDFYYHSPEPYQRYILWSAGPNGKTFPPWLDRSRFGSARDKERIASWTHDDLLHMSK